MTTTVTVGASPSSTTFGQTVTITATVAPASGSVMPTGTVTFTDGSTTLGSAPLQNGQATRTASTLAVGQHSLTASYGGDPGDAASTSSAATENVAKAPVARTRMVSPAGRRSSRRARATSR